MTTKSNNQVDDPDPAHQLFAITQAIFHLAPIPQDQHESFLIALQIEAEATLATERCSRRTCRKTGKCGASRFDGFNHPCGIAWQVETIRNILMMQIFHFKMAGTEVSGMQWWKQGDDSL